MSQPNERARLAARHLRALSAETNGSNAGEV